MHFLGRMFIDLVVAMFFVGLAGSAVVILLAFAEDFRELFGSDETASEATGTSHSAPPTVASSQVASK